MSERNKPHNGRDTDGRFRVRQADVEDLLASPEGTDFVRDDVRLGGAIADTGPHGTIPVKLKTRGIWRLKNCQFPPVRMNFTSEAVKHTPFAGLDQPKLVNHCRDDDTYEQYVLQEFQLYRIYRLLTPASHAVRLVKMTYADSGKEKEKPLAVRYAFIEEPPGELASRLNARQTKIKGAGPSDLEPFQSALVGVFQYMRNTS